MKTNTLILSLILLTSCSTTTTGPKRDIASDKDCFDLVQMINNPKPAQFKPGAAAVAAVKLAPNPNIDSEFRKKIVLATKDKPFDVNILVAWTATAEEMDKALVTVNGKVVGEGFPLETVIPQGNRNIIIDSKEQADKLLKVFDTYHEGIGYASLRAVVPAKAVAKVVRDNITAEVEQTLLNATKEQPALIRLSVVGVEEADKMDAALNALGIKIEGWGFPLESYPPQGSRHLIIESRAQAEKVLKIINDYPRAISASTIEKKVVKLVPDPVAVVKKQMVNAADQTVMLAASKEKPIEVRLSVYQGSDAASMDRALKEVGAKLSGSGFPMETYPPMGGRTLVLETKEQAEKLLRVIDDHPNSIGSAQVKAYVPAKVVPDLPPAVVKKAVRENISPEDEKILLSANFETPVTITISVHAVKGADEMDQALNAMGVNIKGRGFPLESYPAQGQRELIIVTRDQAEDLLAIMSQYPKAIGRSTVKKAVPQESWVPPRSPGEILTALDFEKLSTATKAQPQKINVSMWGIREADDMDEELRSVGAKIEGEGFPLESNPPQGGRIITVESKEQASKLKDILAKYDKVVIRSRFADQN